MVRKVRVTRVKDWFGGRMKGTRGRGRGLVREAGRERKEGKERRERATNHRFPTDRIYKRIDDSSESFSSYFGSSYDGGVTVHACLLNGNQKTKVR